MSTIKFFCGQCGQSLEAETDMAGQNITCPTCQKLVGVPLARTRAEPVRLRAPVRKPAYRRWPVIGSVLVFAAVLFVLAVIVFQGAFRQTSPPAASGGTDNSNAVQDSWAEARAWYQTGLRHLNGDGVALDAGLAFGWIQKAAQSGYPPAQLKLGNMYVSGLGISPDHAEAVQWFRIVAIKGYPEAQANLGMMYLRGLGVVQSDADAAFWYRRSALQGHPPALAALGLLCAGGHGVPLDLIEGYKWLTLAAAREIDPAREMCIRLKADMPSSQVAEALRLAAAFTPRPEIENQDAKVMSSGVLNLPEDPTVQPAPVELSGQQPSANSSRAESVAVAAPASIPVWQPEPTTVYPSTKTESADDAVHTVAVVSAPGTVPPQDRNELAPVPDLCEMTIATLQSRPRDRAAIENLRIAIRSESNSPNRARAAAIYTMACLVSGNPNEAASGLAFLKKLHPDSDYVASVDPAEFQTECNACEHGSVKKFCTACSGQGACRECKGAGKRVVESFGNRARAIPCAKCGGSGKCTACGGTRQLAGRCAVCTGTGRVLNKQSIDDRYMELLSNVR